MGDITEHFSYSEFACQGKSYCRCRYRKGYQIDLDLVMKLQTIRLKYKKVMPINSGIRCEKWNKHEGGKVLSYHVKGLAADIGVTDRRGKIIIVRAAIDLGLSCGVYSWGIHLDNRPVQVLF